MIPINSFTSLRAILKTKLHVGDNWQFLTRLRQIHGTENPGGFDYEKWALQKGLRATGYVLKIFIR